MSHALLLRLFLSPYFSISVAMHYLKTYPESIGISHYLCWRMKQMKAEEVEFYWPQICHLLITRPTESNALESFVVERAEESTHSAMLTFWFMSAALRDLINTRATNPQPFMICQRVLHRCHEIIFGDAPDPSQSPYKSLPTTPYGSTVAVSRSNSRKMPTARVGEAAKRVATGLRDRCRQQKVNAHIPAALVGMGVVLAGGPGMPDLVEMTGQVAVTQGRRPRDDLDDTRRRIEVAMDEGSDGPRGGEDVMSRIQRGNTSASDDSEPESSHRRDTVRKGSSLAPSPTTASLPKTRQPPDSIKLDSPPKGRKHRLQSMENESVANLANQSHHPSHTSPSIIQVSSPFQPSHLLPSPSAPEGSKSSKNLAAPGHGVVPPVRPSSAANFTQTSTAAPFHSVPSFPAQQIRVNALRMPMPSAESLVSMYDADAQRALLRSHYCRSEFRFLSALEDISTRLLVIPKPARLSALRAELTGLNHSLPAEVCMPLWCPADHSHEEGGETRNGTSLLGRRDREATSRVRGHHRIVRISPGDSVVLNSAQKVPYLLHLEILEDDLDFDPSRRPNRELLKKIAVQEEYKKRKREGIETIENGPRGKLDGLGWSSLAPASNGHGASDSRGQARRPSSPRRPSGPSSPTLRRDSLEPRSPDDPEEVDLIEQLFGSDYSSKDRKVNLVDSLPVPVAPQNKHLDAATWSKADLSPSLSRQASTMSHPATPTDSPKMAQGNPLEEDSAILEAAAIPKTASSRPVITLEDYSERMRTAAVMLAQLNASMKPDKGGQQGAQNEVGMIPGRGAILSSVGGAESLVDGSPSANSPTFPASRMRLNPIQATAIRDRIMQEMMSLEEERVARMTAQPEGYTVQPSHSDGKTAEDENIIRRELNKEDPSAVIFKESWTAKKSRIQAASPWGHLARWNVLSVIVKTGDDLRQEQLATQLIQRFGQIWKEENCDCWVRFFRILVTGDNSGLVETITDAVSVHSIKKAEYARRMTTGALGNVTLMDYFVQTYGDPDSGRFAKAQRNFIKSLAAYSVITFLLQIKDRHNGNILIDRDGHLIHIDFGFMLSNSPGGNMRFEAAPFKLTMDYVEIMGGLDSPGFAHFKKLFKEGFETARKHSDSIITMVELMQRNSKLDCFQMYGEQTANYLRERFQLGLTTQAVDAYMERLILTSVGSSWTRLYDSYQYYHEGVL